LARLKGEGITIIVSTPYMDEALRCDRIALIQSGRILNINTPDKIRRSYSQKLFAVSHPEKYKLLLTLRTLTSGATTAAGQAIPRGAPAAGQPASSGSPATEGQLPSSSKTIAGNAEPFGDSVHITLTEGTAPDELTAALTAAGLPGATVTEIVPGIEDVFLELMKREA
ncbi:MAG: hypothetical protein IH592_06625, partial [Bacteroidales bacterium]|nr:hypothetical protein [Bacteroidales bacterium]